MPKSKEFIDSSDSDEAKTSNKNNSASDEETAKASTSKKSKSKSSNNTDDPPAKRAKKSDEADTSEVPSTTGPNGERLYEIGRLRFISVSQFKGKPYVNIREYYDDHGTQKPGKKGISLGADQWEKLKTLVNQIDKDLKKSK